MNKQSIYCCNCAKTVMARLTDGKEIYPHRNDLFNLPFWICDTCKGKVGCHHKTNNRAKPLGVIPSAEISKIRGRIHSLIDPIWKLKLKTRREIYKIISDILGYSFHSAEIRTEEEALKCLEIATEIRNNYRF